MYKKVFLPVVLIVINIFSVGGATNLGPNQDPPKIRNVVIGNWNNIMDPHGCVILDEDNYLKIKGVFTFAVNDLNPFQSIYYTTQFGNGNTILYGPIQNSDLTQIVLPSGDIAYEFVVDAYTGDFASECSQNPGNPISFAYNISLTDSNGDPYPLTNNPELYTLYNSQNTEPGNIPDPLASYQGVKNLCCEGTNTGNDRSSSNESGDNVTEVTKTDFLKPIAYPNPFRNMVQVEFLSVPQANTMIEIRDSKGLLVYSKIFYFDSSNIQKVEIDLANFNSGLYYCRVKNSLYSDTFNLLKIQ